MSRLMLLSVTWMIAAAVPATARAATPIDNFEEGPLSITLGPAPPNTSLTQPFTQTGLATTNVLTGTRDGLFRMNGPSATMTVEPGSASLDDGVLRLTASANSGAAVTFTLIDDSAGVDLLQYGTAIEVFFEAAPSFPDTFMQMTDTSGRQSQLAINYHGPGSYVWGIPQGIGNSADGRDVARLTWRASVPAGSEVRVSGITIIPEPASCAMMLTAAAPVILRRRRRST